MRFISVRDLRSKSAELWRDLPAEGQMVVTSNGKPVAILAAVEEEGVEQTLASFRRNRALTAVERQQLKSVASGRDRITMEEIDEEIRAVRRSRRVR
jgi:antitoxin (DNA-binding transcriptional repressor) of toxin-antitoxin stability system